MKYDSNTIGDFPSSHDLLKRGETFLKATMMHRQMLIIIVNDTVGAESGFERVGLRVPKVKAS